MQHCPDGRGRGGPSRGRGNKGKRGARGGGGGRDEQGFNQSSATWGASYHQYSEGCDHGNYLQFGAPNYNGGGRGGYAGSGQEYSGAAGYAGHSGAGYGYSPSPGAANEPYYHGYDNSGYNESGRGGVGGGYVGYPAHHGAARRGQSFNGQFRAGRNGGSGHQEFAGARSGDAGVRGQRGAGRRRPGVGRRGYARGGRGHRGGPRNRGRSVSSRRSNTTDDSDGESSTEQKSGRSKPRPESNRKDDKGERKKSSRDANVSEKRHSKPKSSEDEKHRKSRKQTSGISNNKGKSRRKSSNEGNSDSSRSSSSASSTSSSDSNSRSSTSDSDSSDGSSSSTASSSSNSSASSNYQSRTDSTNRSKRYSRGKESSNIHEKSCRCKKCKERYADNPVRKSKLSREKSHDAGRSSKTSSRRKEGGSAHRQRKSKDEYDSSDLESESESMHTSRRKHDERSSNNSRDYVGYRKDRSKSNRGAAAKPNKSRDEPRKHDNSRPKTSSSASVNQTKKKQSSAESSSNTTTPRLVPFTTRNKQNVDTTSSSTTTPTLVHLPPRNKQNREATSSNPTTPRLVPLTPRNTQNADTTPSPVSRYEWQFQDNKGSWISFGQSNTKKGSDSATTASSNDIEAHYNNDPARSPVQIQSNSYHYVLDFQTMTQTNTETSAQRPIRRILKQAVTPVVLPKKVSSGAGTYSSTASVHYEWQFKDEKGAWIRYGSPTTGGDLSCVTTTSSDDIEKFFSSDPDKSPLLIQSNSHQYILDFQAMTQTNQNTSAQRQIRRVLQQAVKPTVKPKPINIQYEWQFQDEHGAWVPYGSPNTHGDQSSVTTTSSDDIEKHYSSDPLKTSLLIQSRSHQYLLDFQAMTQTNQSTFVSRSIRRVATQPGKRIVTKSPKLNYFGAGTSYYQYEWQFQDENGGWIRYGSPNSSGDLSCVTKITSDDIEKHYSSSLSRSLSTQSSRHRYLLDLQNMTQTNQTSMTQRPIRRVLTQPSQSSRTPHVSSNYRQFFNSVFAANNGRQSTVAYEWFFLDENKSWIPYGQPNSLNKTDCVTSASSDDIEKHYQQNPNQSIDIASQKYTYRLDFVNMTQTNKQTLAVRQISRRPTTQQGFSASGRRSDLNSHSSSNSDLLPSNWASMAHSSAWTAVPLSAIDHEYIKHVGIIKQTVPTFNVRRMYRVQNPFLWKAYVNKKDYMNKQNPGIKFREEYLYHGTDPKNVKAICEENIDWRLHGTSHGQSQGRGAYFAKSPNLATKYSGQQGVVFIVKVLVGHTTTGSPGTVKPPKDKSGKPYDTTVDNEINPSIFVKYDTQEYYPEYYVEF